MAAAPPTREKLEYFAWKHPEAAKWCKRGSLVLCCFPCLLLWMCCVLCCDMNSIKCGNGLRDAYIAKQLRMMDITFRKQEKVHRRRHSLSEPVRKAPGIRGAFSRNARTSSQSQSTFFTKLPLEVRMRIYEMALCDEPFLHIQFDTDRFTIVECDSFYEEGVILGEGELGIDIGHLPCVEMHGPKGPHKASTWWNVKSKRDRYVLPPLLKACRRMYAEAIGLVYTGNTFELKVGYDIVNFARSIPDRHLQNIRSLTLHIARLYLCDSQDWKDTLEVLKKMPGLTSCRVVIREFYNLDLTAENMLQCSLASVQKVVDSLRCMPARDAFTVLLAGYVRPSDGRGRMSFRIFGRWKLKDLDWSEVAQDRA